MIFVLISVFLGAFFFEGPGLIRNKHWRELAVFSTLLLFAFTLAVLQNYGVKLPSPSKMIDFLVRDLMHLNYE